MFCSNCGASMPEGQPFCTNCGAPLTDQQPLQGGNGASQQISPKPPKAPKAPKPKKALLSWIIAGVATVAVITGVVLGWGYIRNFVERTFSSPEKYYQTVEKRAISSATDALVDTTDLAGSMFSPDSKNAVQGSITVSMGKEFTDLISDEVGTDMSWFKNAGMSFTLDQTHGDLIGAKATVQLNGTDIANLDGMYEKDSRMIYFRVPECSKQYAGMNLEDLLDLYYEENGYDQTYAMLSNLVYADDSQIQAIMGAMPDSKTLNKVIERYANIIIKNLDEVDRGSETVTAGDITCSYTTLEVEIDSATLESIAKDVVNTAVDDKDLKEIIYSFATAMGEDGDELYASLQDELRDADISIDEDILIKMVVYVNGEGEVKGRDIQIKADGSEVATIRYLVTEKGGKFGAEFRIKTPDTTISLEGDGTKRGDMIKGTLDAKVSSYGETHKLGTIEIDGSTKDDSFEGDITFAPSEEVLEAMLSEVDLPPFLTDMVRNIKITLSNHSSKNHLDVSLALKSDSTELITVRFECKEVSPLDLSVPSDYMDPEEWVQSMDQSNLMTLIGNLQKAGVPMSLFSDLGDLF